jgi:adenylate cyclase
VEPRGPGDPPRPPPEGEFTRRVCAVLLADVTNFSALMGVDDERTASAVAALQTLVQGIASEHNGHAEGFAGDAIFASFDSVVAAVAAALAIQQRITATTFAGLQLRIRIGVHYGDVLLREGSAFGDAINIAARLQTLAKPGAICMSDGVYRQVRNKFDEKFTDLGFQKLKNISEPVRAYLLLPHDLVAETEQQTHARRTRSTRIAAAVTLAAVAILAAILVPRVWRRTHPSSPGPIVMSTDATPVVSAGDIGQVTLGVMVFKKLAAKDEERDWRREALRDGLNAQLSQLSQVKVYSKEFIDFLMTRKGLSDVEAASQLGIKKMLSGSFIVVGGVVRIETHIVDVASGVMEASYATSGKEDEFLQIQNKLAFGVISHLNLPVTDQEKRTLLAQQTTDVDALKMLLEAEGGAAPAAPPPGSDDEPQSALPTWLAALRGAVLAPAVAAEPTADQTAILAVIESYRRATESRQMPELAAVYTAFAPEQQAAQQRYFDNVRDLHVVIDNVDMAVVGDEAVVSYTRTDDFLDVRTGRPMHVAVRLTKTLRRVDGAWKMAAAK